MPRGCRRRASPTGTGNTGGVRTVPLVGDKAWFGPRRFGWGLSPMSPEGWVLTAASLVATFVLARVLGSPWLSRSVRARSNRKMANAAARGVGGGPVN